MKKKGFTLVELLAVIVVLAIIAIIAVPIILNVINNSKKGSAIDSAYNYVDAVEKYIVMHEMDETKYPIDLKSGVTYQVSNTPYSEISSIDLIEKVYAEDSIILNSIIKIKGTKPSSGIVTISEKRKLEKAILVIDSYKVICEKGICNVDGETVASISVNSVITTPNRIIISYTSYGEIECLYGENYEYKGTVNGNTCIISNLSSNTNYKYKIIASDTKGSVEEVGDITTNDTPNINIEVSNPEKYEQRKIVTITGSSENSILQYRIGSGQWNNYEGPFEITENTVISARLYNQALNEEISFSTEIPTKIDNTPPELTVGTITVKSDSVIVPYETDDLESNIDKVKIEYGTTEDLENSLTCSNNKCELSSLTPGMTYYYKLTSKNGAGLISEISSSVATSQQSTQQTYYEFGDPTTSSTTDYTTLNKSVFDKLQGDQKSVCIVVDNVLECFKNNNYEEESNHVKEVFSESECSTDSNLVGCYGTDFYCEIWVVGQVNCTSRKAKQMCHVYKNGVGNCVDY